MAQKITNSDNVKKESKVYALHLIPLKRKFVSQKQNQTTHTYHFHQKAYFLRIHVNFNLENIAMHTEHSIRVHLYAFQLQRYLIFKLPHKRCITLNLLSFSCCCCCWWFSFSNRFSLFQSFLLRCVFLIHCFHQFSFHSTFRLFIDA